MVEGYRRDRAVVDQLLDEVLARPDLEALDARIGLVASLDDPDERAEALLVLYADLSADVAYLFGVLDRLDPLIELRDGFLSAYRMFDGAELGGELPDAFTTTLAELPIGQLDRDLSFWRAFRAEVAGLLGNLEDLRLLLDRERCEGGCVVRDETTLQRRVFRGQGTYGITYYESGEQKCTISPSVDIELVLQADYKATLSFSDAPQTRGRTVEEGGVVKGVVDCFLMGEDPDGRGPRPGTYTGEWAAGRLPDRGAAFILFGKPPHAIVIGWRGEWPEGIAWVDDVEIALAGGARVYGFDFELPEVP